MADAQKAAILERAGPDLKYDEVGYWSEIKLDIVKEYAQAYSTILSGSKKAVFDHFYIDAFAGAGKHISKQTNTFILGSPLNALAVNPSFKRFFLIDIDKRKTKELRAAVAGRSDVTVFDGDCNEVLLRDVFPNVRYRCFERALCLLDPYGLHLRWEVIQAAADAKSIDIFLNFPVMDMNMNVLWRSGHESAGKEQIARMNSFWGGDTWKSATYTENLGLFGSISTKVDNDSVARAFQKRLREVAQFEHVPDPIPMRNGRGNVIYYLFFASHRPVAAKIVTQIFDKYKDRRS